MRSGERVQEVWQAKDRPALIPHFRSYHINPSLGRRDSRGSQTRGVASPERMAFLRSSGDSRAGMRGDSNAKI